MNNVRGQQPKVCPKCGKYSLILDTNANCLVCEKCGTKISFEHCEKVEHKFQLPENISTEKILFEVNIFQEILKKINTKYFSEFFCLYVINFHFWLCKKIVYLASNHSMCDFRILDNEFEVTRTINPAEKFKIVGDFKEKLKERLCTNDGKIAKALKIKNKPFIVIFDILPEWDRHKGFIYSQAIDRESDAINFLKCLYQKNTDSIRGFFLITNRFSKFNDNNTIDLFLKSKMKLLFDIRKINIYKITTDFCLKENILISDMIIKVLPSKDQNKIIENLDNIIKLIENKKEIEINL